MRSLLLIWTYLRVNTLNELQYRANLLVQVFQSAISLVTGLAVIGLVFGHTDNLNGWTQAELYCVMGIHIAMGGLIGTIIQPNMVRLMEEIRDGKLDFALTKPADAQVLASVREVQIWRSVDVIIGAIVLAFGLSRLDTPVTPEGFAAFLIAIVLGALMIYCFWLIITVAAFWVVRMDQLAELFEGVYQSGRWPVTIYPGWLQVSLTFLVPIAFAVTVPAEALTSRLTVETLVIAAVFALGLFLFTRWWWRFGLRRYAGASA
jgi:viologen exporter family transport system permease protein